VLAAVQVQQMDNPLHGWVVLVTSLAVIECVSALYNFDQFMKKKRQTFDAASPMVDASQQQARLAREAAEPLRSAPAFSFPLNEFSGHARVTNRQR
jgi:hypothetical protein